MYISKFLYVKINQKHKFVNIKNIRIKWMLKKKQNNESIN